MTTTPFRGLFLLAPNLLCSGASNRYARRVPVLTGRATLAAIPSPHKSHQPGASRAILLVLLTLAALFTGCASVKEGHEPFVVQSERALTVAKASIEAFVSIEHDNRAWCRDNLPRVHESAEFMRKHAPKALDAAGKALRRYKAGRTPELKTAAREALIDVQGLAYEAAENLTNLQANKP